MEPTPDSAGRRRPAGGDGVRTGRLRVHDPFELIRWLALSQPDPRKAVSELVQNSLDAVARTVRVTRVRRRGVPCLRVWDDGEGVIPELGRVEALHFIATHIGHSRKRQLTPQQRLELMTQGQYGIGLLGFWSLGETLELRTCLPGQGAHRLVLRRDSPEFRIEPLRGRLPLDERWTEVVVASLHPEVLPLLVARRMADFLAAELRGQLLSRPVRLELVDGIARGRAIKHWVVQPRRYLGERLELPAQMTVAGFPLHLELYFAGEEPAGEAPPVALYVAGSLVAEGFEELAGLGLDHPPWTDRRLTGYVDCPALTVAPGSRRSVVPDAPAGAFARALLDLELLIDQRVEAMVQSQAETLERDVVRSLRRAFRDFYRQRPRFSLLPVAAERDGGGPQGAEAGAPAPGVEEESVADEVESPWPPVAELFPPGPLAEVRLVPGHLRLECGERRLLRARPLDAAGRRPTESVAYEWRVSGGVGTLEEVPGAGERRLLAAAAEPATGCVVVTARAGDGAVEAEAAVEVVEELRRRSEEGIPEPELVDQPGAAWRSRLADGRWQINVGHPDYRAVAGRAALKLRYLVLLFSKEVVSASAQDPRLAAPLEQLVEVAAFADRNLQGERGRGRRARAQ